MNKGYVIATRTGNYFEVDCIDLSKQEIASISNLIIDRLNEAGILGLTEEVVTKHPKIGPAGWLIAKRHIFKAHIEQAKEQNGEQMTTIISLNGNRLKIETGEPCHDIVSELRIIGTLVYEYAQFHSPDSPFIMNSNIFVDFKSGMMFK